MLFLDNILGCTRTSGEPYEEIIAEAEHLVVGAVAGGGEGQGSPLRSLGVDQSSCVIDIDRDFV